MINYPQEFHNDITVVTAPKKLEGNESISFRDAIIDIVEKGTNKLIIDLTSTEFMDSEGISAIVARISLTRSNNGDIRLIVKTEFVKHILEVTHLDKMLQTFNSLDAALGSFK